MSIFNGFRRQLVDPALWRILKIQFHRSTMNDNQKSAYEELVKQVDLRVMEKKCDQQEITVPASIKPQDAQKALKLIKLEFDSTWDFHVTWEGQENKKTLLTEKKPGEQKPDAPKPATPDAPKP